MTINKKVILYNTEDGKSKIELKRRKAAENKIDKEYSSFQGNVQKISAVDEDYFRALSHDIKCLERKNEK